MEIIVHVGDGKTGSSAIQKMLRSRKEDLAGHGVAYLGMMLESATRKYVWQRAARIESFHALPAAQATAEMTEVLRDSLATARVRGIKRLVLSNETLLGRGATTIAALNNVAQDGVVITPVAYVRRHDEWARSAYVQWGLKHKTYAGPIRDFASWSDKKSFAVFPKLQAWLDAFGDTLVLRNFNATTDVAGDFLAVLGLDVMGVEAVRANETPGAEELALRTMFNHRQEAAVAPNRFNRLFDATHLNSQLTLDALLQSNLPNLDQLTQINEVCRDDRTKVNALLEAQGQLPLPSGPLQHTPPELDQRVVVSLLFQMIANQAERIEKLEHKLAAALPVATVSTTPLPAPISLPATAPTGADADPAIAAVLAPALGYFGANQSDHLQVEVGGVKVRELRISVSEAQATFLNLKKLELVHAGKVLALPAEQCRASQSSLSGGDPINGPDGLLTGTGIHSSGERDPWWSVRFDPPVEVDQLRVFNRSDGWGSRSRTLAITMLAHDGSSSRLYRGQDEDNFRRVLAAAGSAAGLESSPALPQDPAGARVLRAQLLALIAGRLRAGSASYMKVDWRALVPMLDVWGSAEPDADEWTMLAAFLLAQQQAKGGTSIKSFSLLLNSQVRLKRLQHELNELAGVLQLGGLMLTRHGVKPVGVLRREPERFLAHMEAVLASLARMGRQPVLAYGTLLGAVREGDFIAHDDDIDLLYRSRSRSRAEVEAELAVIKEALRADGFRVVDLLPNSLNMHVIDASNGAVMDVFPCWEEQGRLQMHMESMKVRGIDPAIVYPIGHLTFRDRQLPAPAQPEAYLAERYGPGWRISDQFFEWPWALKEPAS